MMSYLSEKLNILLSLKMQKSKIFQRFFVQDVLAIVLQIFKTIKIFALKFKVFANKYNINILLYCWFCCCLAGENVRP